MPNTIDSFDAFATLAREKDLFSALEQLQSSGTPLQIAKTFETLHLDAYWKKKDLPLTIALAQAGILFCLTHAGIATDPAVAISLRATAKGLAYNLASFAWPGWDEPGIQPTPNQIALGLHAARFNLRMAYELQKPLDKIRAAHWLLGAQLLAAPHPGHVEESLTEFRQSIPPEPTDPDHPLYTGYVLLAQLLLAQSGADRQWEELLEKLEARTDQRAKFDHDQLSAARRVFNGHHRNSAA